ncbi:MAG: biopolymer transporter ExbD [Treponema sp.]|jgi:biopolymer transport protein ExbD|nr:biopolymer transporter ExbD [Treponema sp.]
MKLNRRKGRGFSVSTNSLSDIAFLLLIFIMLVALINYRVEVKIDYPEAKTALRTASEKNLEVWIDRDGGVYLNGIDSNLLAFEQEISRLYRTAPDTRVHIIADRNTPYEKINAALEIMQVLQYRVVSFVVRNAE